MFKTCFCNDVPEEGFHKVGAVAVLDRRLLVVRKRGKKGFIIPGGKHERDESFEECLRRELQEELQVDLVSFNFFRRYQGEAHFEKVPMIMDLYFVDFRGEIRIDSEIKEFLWIDRNYKEKGVPLAGALEFFTVPELLKIDLI